MSAEQNVNAPRRKALGSRLRGIRHERGYNQEKLAEIAGMSRTHLSSVERGQGNISIDLLWRIADVLDVHVTFLLDEARPGQKVRH